MGCPDVHTVQSIFSCLSFHLFYFTFVGVAIFFNAIAFLAFSVASSLFVVAVPCAFVCILYYLSFFFCVPVNTFSLNFCFISY